MLDFCFKFMCRLPEKILSLLCAARASCLETQCSAVHTFLHHIHKLIDVGSFCGVNS
jgi:hypothetical protein